MKRTAVYGIVIAAILVGSGAVLALTQAGTTVRTSDPLAGLDNPVWTNLSFVQDGNVHGIGVLHADGSGPIGLAYFVDNVVKALTQ